MKSLLQLAVCAVIGITLAIVASRGDKSPAASDAPDANFYAAREFIRKQLKAPSTATFSNRGDDATGIHEIRPGYWDAWGTVDAQNSFGAMIRQPWEIIFPSNGVPVYSRLGDDQTGSKEDAMAGVASSASSEQTVREDAIAESKRRAISKHPLLSVAGSPFNQQFVAAYQRLAAAHSARLKQPDWPESLADECAAATASSTR